MNVSGTKEENLEWNLKVWKTGWRNKWRYGYKWGFDAVEQKNNSIAPDLDYYLNWLPKTAKSVLEIGCGAGRFSAGIIPYTEQMHLFDISKQALQICEKRFKYYPCVYTYQDIKKTPATPDAVISYDAMVHMHPDIIYDYAKRFAYPGIRLIWDTSGTGERKAGSRTAVTAGSTDEMLQKLGFKVLDQWFRNDNDVITVAQI